MRIKRLDVLRCVAVLLVIGAHANIFRVASRVGWTGVDLFFVLSGFLISGLLYSEYKDRQAISFRRFFIRRGLKIYPAFYVLILVTFAGQHLLWHGRPSPLRNFLWEVIFVQNYLYGVWNHTWSLAVEEHFYIGLALLLLILARLSTDRVNPFRRIPLIFVIVGIACITLRVLTIWWLTPAGFLTPYVMNPTHTRIDGLFFGVVLGYLYHFCPESIRNALRPAANRLGLAILSAVLLSTCYFFSRDDHFLLSFGLTFLYLGFGGVLLLCFEVRGLLTGRTAKLFERIGTGCSYVGQHSYSIYLWHSPFLTYVPLVLQRYLGVRLPFPVMAVILVTGSCASGILFARLIEFPVLRFRDRFFPMLRQPRGTPRAPSSVRQGPSRAIGAASSVAP